MNEQTTNANSSSSGRNASRYVNKFNYINLARHRYELDAMFDSIIDKLPDLCMPARARLAGENDFFDETRRLKLIPFRKQEVFDRCISPVNNHSQGVINTHCLLAGKNSGGCQGHNSKQRPFANPMPECMLIEENKDNLREIIVSSLDIEWKMLTPIRAGSEYENNYFDKLIQLHRNRYKTRLEAGHFKGNKKSGPAVFRHTRHGISLQHSMLCGQHHNQSNRRLNPTVGVKLKRKFKARSERSKSIVPYGSKLTIPTLTLTNNDEQQSTSEPIMPSKLDGDDDDDEEEEQFHDTSNYGYENFSRYSRRNSTTQMPIKNQLDVTPNEDSHHHGVTNNGVGLMRGDNLLDDQVEDILNHLMVDLNV